MSTDPRRRTLAQARSSTPSVRNLGAIVAAIIMITSVMAPAIAVPTAAGSTGATDRVAPSSAEVSNPIFLAADGTAANTPDHDDASPSAAGITAQQAGEITIEQTHGFTTGKGKLNATKQVGIQANRSLSFDNGTNYRLRLTNEDTGENVTLTLDGSVDVPAGDPIGLLVYEGDGVAHSQPAIWPSNQSDPMPAAVVGGSIPSASGLTNFSVTLLDGNGTEINTTETAPAVIGYQGTLTQNSSSGLVRLSLPRDGLPTDADGRLQISEGTFDHQNNTEYQLSYNSSSDTFETVVNASELFDGNYSWRATFLWQNVRILQHRSTSSESETEPEPGGVIVSGQLDEPDGSPAANDTLRWDGRDVDDGQTTVTTSTGNFSVNLIENGTYDVRYWQDDPRTSNDIAFPKDGTVDVLSADRVAYDSDVSLGTGTLPIGHNLTVTVVNESGHPVENATVTVIDHAGPTDDPLHTRVQAETDATGELVHPESDGPGFEVNGTVHVQVERSADMSGNGTTVEVDRDRHLTLTVQPSVNVSGQIVEADGSPAANDELIWHGWDVNDGAHNITSEQGEFATRLVENGTYEVTYRQDDPRTAGDIAFPKDGSVDVFSFGTVSYDTDTTSLTQATELPQGHNLTVQVVNSSGHPIENARVQVIHVVDVPNTDRRASAHVEAITDGSGELVHPESDGPGFEVNGTVEVHVEPPHDGLSQNGTRVEVKADKRLVITLTSDVEVSGELSEADGSPAANDTLRWSGRDVDDGAGNVTSSTGAFAVSLTEGGTYDVRYWQDDRRTSSDVAFPKDGTVDVLAADRATYDNDTDLSGTLPVGHNLTVTVVDGSGNPVEDATVAIIDHTDVPNTDDDLHAHVQAQTNATGDLVHPESDGPGFEVNGTVHVQVERTGSHSGNGTTVEVDGDRHLTLTVHPAVNVSGQVFQADGEPAANDVIEWRGWDVNGGAHNITSDQGAFATRLVENGTYEVVYWQDDPRRNDDIAFPKDGSVDVFTFGIVSYGADATGLSRTLPEGHNLTVTVVNESGHPVENARVHLNHVVDVPNTDRRASAHVEAITDGSGELVHPESDGPGFEVNGTIEVQIEPPRSGLSANGTRVEVDTDTHLTLVLEEEATAFGQIVRPDGSAAANEFVVANNATSGVFNAVQTNSSGYYAVGMNKEEQTSLTFVQSEVFSDSTRHDGIVDLYEFAEVTLSSDSDLGEEQLPAGHVLNISVENESGAPVENASIDVAHNSGVNVEPAELNFDSNADGMFQAGGNSTPGVEVAGNVTVTVRPPENADGYADETYTRELDVTTDTDITITLQEAVEVTGRLLEPDGSAATNDTVLASNGTQTETVKGAASTGDDGNYSLEVPRNEPISLVFIQVGEDQDGLPPRDGVVDLYELAEVELSASSDLGDTNLPDGHVLNVTVVNQSAVPVENASVRIRHEGKPNVQSITPVVPTNADGMFQIENLTPGIEVVGNVTVTVEPPEDATGFVDQSYTKELNITSDRSINVTLQETDLTPPTITNAMAVDAGDGDVNVTDGDLVEISADVSDDKSDVDTVVADASAFGGGNVTLTDVNDDGTYNATFVVDGASAPVEGPDVIDVFANDTADNGQAASTNELILDLSAPFITNASVAAGAVVNENTTITLNYTDALSGVNASAVTLLVDGTEKPATATASQLIIDVGALGLADGRHNFTVVIVDRVGLENVSSTDLTVDSASPNVTELSHSRDGQPVSTNAPTTFTVNVTDPHPGEAWLIFENASTGDIVYKANVTDAFQGTDEVTWDATTILGDPVATGNYTVIVEADDSSGHTTTTSIEVGVDNTAPSIDSFAPADGALLNTSSPDVAATYSDVGSGVNTTDVTLIADGDSVSIDPANVTASSLSTSLTLSESDNSSHTITLDVVDDANNSARLTRTFTVDTEAPRIDLESSVEKHVSTNNPTDITVSRTDAHPNATTLVIENASTGAVVDTIDLTGKLGSGTATVQWDATDSNGDPVPTDRYDLVLTSDDQAGNANTTTVSVFVDNTDPTVGFVALNVSDGTSEAPAWQTLYTNDTVGFNATADGTPGEAANVTFRLSAMAVNFETDTAGTAQNGHWTAVADLAGIPDDGEYEGIAIVEDAAKNTNRTTADATVIVDRQAPELGATVSRVDDTTGRVNLTVSDANPPASADAVHVEVTLPNGTTVTVPMSGPSDSAPQWTGTFELSDTSGDYDVVATALDNASNRGRATAWATIQQVSTQNRTVTVQVKATGTFVRFNTTQEVDNTFVSLTSSDDSPAPLAENLTGVSFLNGQLGDALDANLSDATIGVPVNESKLPEGVSKENATIGFFNTTTGAWEVLNTSTKTETVNGTTDEYWVTNVTHFSTYGAVAQDTTPPTLLSRSPDADTTLSYGTTEHTVRFEYDDDVTGVNASAVTIEFDGADVTGDDATQVTSQYAEHTATGLDPGDYTATVTVVDEAGNEDTFSTSFTVPEDTTAPSVLDRSPTDGAELSAGTSSVTLEVTYEDTESGINTSAIVVTFDGQDVTSAASVTSSKVSYTNNSLTDGSSHTFMVTIVDNNGNVETETIEFSVASLDTSGGQTGGGTTGGTSTGTTDDEPSESVSVDVSTTAAGFSATIENAGANQQVAVDVPDRASTVSEGVALSSIEITPTTAANFSLEVTAEQGDAPPVSEREDALGYLEVGHTIDDADVSGVTFEFTLTASTLESRGIAADEVALYRYHDGEWTELETTLTNASDGVHTYEAVSPGLSVFAISRSGASGPTFSVTDAAVGQTAVDAGDSVDIEATVENTGDRSGTVTLELTVAGDVVDSVDVEVAAGGSETVSFSHTFEEAGTFDVAVEDTDAGTVSVESVSTAASPGTASGDASPVDTARPVDEGPGGLPISTTALALVVLVVLIALAIVARRRL